MNKNMKDLKVAVLGGDKRLAVIADEFLKRGYETRLFAPCDIGAVASPGAEICMSAEKALEAADIAILPLPVTRDNVNLSAHGSILPLYEIIRLAARNHTIILGGMMPEEIMKQCDALGVEVYDYYKSESLQRKNALPSAEGALMIAMEHTDITVKGMKAMVCGYGRIGSLLADMLAGLGAEVIVAARRDEVLCEISIKGLDAVRIDGDGKDLGAAARECDVIFNTIPSVIFTEKVLSLVKNKPLYIEIASSPGGIDHSAARSMGIETVFAPSLPSKYAPESAGRYVFETVLELLSERRKI